MQRDAHFRTCSTAREEAGFEPLAAGHPISWRAIETRRQSRMRAPAGVVAASASVHAA